LYGGVTYKGGLPREWTRAKSPEPLNFRNPRPQTPKRRPKTPKRRPKTPKRRPKTPNRRPKTPNRRPKMLGSLKSWPCCTWGRCRGSQTVGGRRRPWSSRGRRRLRRCASCTASLCCPRRLCMMPSHEAMGDVNWTGVAYRLYDAFGATLASSSWAFWDRVESDDSEGYEGMGGGREPVVSTVKHKEFGFVRTVSDIGTCGVRFSAVQCGSVRIVDAIGAGVTVYAVRWLLGLRGRRRRRRSTSVVWE
jgi:hypothetical protein